MQYLSGLTFIIQLDQLTLTEWHNTFQKCRHFQRYLFMEQHNLSWTLWMQMMVLGKSWRHLRAATINTHRCLRSSVCMCTHEHAWFQIKYVTRNKWYAKGKAWSWPRHDGFILNPKFCWNLADGHKHSHQSPEVSTNVVMEDLPIVSTRPSLCSQGVPIAAVMSVADWCVSKLRFFAG